MTTLKLKLIRMRTPMVGVLQDMLKRLDYDPGPVDSVFGRQTRAGVLAFQKAEGLTADGVAGLQTFERLYTKTGDVPASEHFDFKTEFDRPHRPEFAQYWLPCPIRYYANAQELFFKMEEIRAAVNAKYAKAGQEIKLHCLSGYRGSVYNDKCGGAGGSMHLAGGALDFFAVLYEKGQQIIHIPNDYQVGLLTKSMAGGFGWGSNNDLHVDIGRTRHWWYKYKSWTSWKANQGKAT